MGQAWVLLVLLSAVGTLGYVNMVSPRKWRLLLRSFFSIRLGRQSLRDDLDLQDRSFIALIIASCAVIGLFIMQCGTLLAGVAPQVSVWVIAFAGALVVMAVQVVLLRVVTGSFQAGGGDGEQVYTLLVLQVVSGLLLLPMVAVIAFPHEPEWRGMLPWVGLCLAGTIVVLRWVRGGWVALTDGVPLRYIFIYLCALEFLPIALVIQYLRAFLRAPITL